MPLVTCPNCHGRNPSSAVACLHCGQLAPLCQDCQGQGVCPLCEGVYAPGFPPCPHCHGTGRCPSCGGNKVRWASLT